MQLLLQVEQQQYLVDPQAIDLAIPLRFNGPQPNSYGVPPAVSQAFEGGGFVGDVRQGGSCNFETYTFTPHCNGTHTEGIGHITKERLAVHEILQDSWLPACVVSLHPRSANETTDQYDPGLQPEDKVLDAAMIEQALAGVPLAFREAVIIRSLPNEPDKKSRDYMQQSPPFFTLEGMSAIRDHGVKHLLVDMPSVDRLYDEGKLNAHHIFWGLDAGQDSLQTEPPAKTITEFIYVPDEVEDGIYLLNLQIAPFMSDAAPSRPQIFRVSSTS
ncbi:MAG: cyclase family protein [Bacteroidota bacterium]